MKNIEDINKESLKKRLDVLRSEAETSVREGKKQEVQHGDLRHRT